MPSSSRKPNHLLRQQRLEQGWTLEQAASELSQWCESEGSARVDVDAKMIGRWERGEHLPSLVYQKKLSQLYGKSLRELGFIQAWQVREEQVEAPTAMPARFPALVPESTEPLSPIDMAPREAIDRLQDTPHLPLNQLAGAWLALGAADLATLFQEGWTLEEVLTSLRIVLEGVQAMPNISRRTFGRRLLELGGVAVVSGVPLPTGKQVSAQERVHLQQALGANIEAGWRLFHTAGNAQVLAVGQAQLALVQHVHALLPARERALFYSAIYDLIGKAYFFQERYDEALHAHQSAYIAALQAGDPWRVSQSLICQADGYQACGQHAEAIQAIEEALRILGTPSNQEQLRSKAHLLACWADNAMTLGEDLTVQRQLEAAAAYLDELEPNEEFDRAIWLQLCGKYALMNGDYLTALQQYEEALAEVPAHWIVRQVLVLVPLMVAYACKRDRDQCLATAEQALVALRVLNAPGLNKQFAEAVRRGILDSFPGDKQVHTFLAEVRQRHPLLRVTTQVEG